MLNFALTGIAGYIAPRHLKAITAVGGSLVAACDPHDSVGVLDSYFPNAAFFKEYERFDRHLEKLRRATDEERVNYVSICSPNHLHDAHIRQALRIGADAICEKPIVLNPWNLDALAELEEEYGQRIWTVLQLRVHPAILELKRRIRGETGNEGNEGNKGNEKRFSVDLTYITTRGLWYDYSWKGDVEKSGGIATNIGVHFFDLLLWLFGYARHSEVHVCEQRKMCGFLELANADVRWCLSLQREDLPEEARVNGNATYRSIRVDGEEIEFTGGFTDLHTEVYRETLAGHGFSIHDAYPSIELVHQLRHSNPIIASDKAMIHNLAWKP
ncbi:MAG: Gfo/Idh/MocA family oxidoreductase [Bacteroidetes bacterium]|nr:Gfo/Idh/MocA family oxidoreductase [Bacteroidota bacterium]